MKTSNKILIGVGIVFLLFVFMVLYEAYQQGKSLWSYVTSAQFVTDLFNAINPLGGLSTTLSGFFGSLFGTSSGAGSGDTATPLTADPNAPGAAQLNQLVAASDPNAAANSTFNSVSASGDDGSSIFDPANN